MEEIPVGAKHIQGLRWDDGHFFGINSDFINQKKLKHSIYHTTVNQQRNIYKQFCSKSERKIWRNYVVE